MANTHSKAFSKFKDKKVVEKAIPSKTADKKVNVSEKEAKKDVAVKQPIKNIAVEKPKAPVSTRQTSKTSVLRGSQSIREEQAVTVVPSQKSKASSTVAKPPSKAPVRSSLRLSARHSLTNDSGETSLYVSALDIRFALILYYVFQFNENFVSDLFIYLFIFFFVQPRRFCTYQ